MILFGVAFYAFVFSVLVLLALERAHRSAHPLNSCALLTFGLGGAASTYLCAIQGVSSLSLLIVFACVSVCAATDLSCGLLYNSVIAISLSGIVAVSIYSRPFDAAAGALVGFGLTLAMHALTRGRGLGFGDVKLFGTIGTGLGALATLNCVGAAFVIGAMCSLMLLAASRISRDASLPFGPYVAVATMVVGSLGLGVA